MMWILLLFVVWHLVPVVLVMRMSDVPLLSRIAAALHFLVSTMPRSTLYFLPNILAPLVVPIALTYTRREDNNLPGLFKWWDNDVSINGDKPEYWDPSYQGTTYYANAHPRSFWARYVWLGFRNRASHLSMMLGEQMHSDDVRQFWGDPQTDRDHEGQVLYKVRGIYQLYICKRLGKKWCFRLNYGNKVWGSEDKEKTAMVVAITASVLSWTGK